MISLKTAVTQLDRLESLLGASRRSYLDTVVAMADHAVEVEPRLVKQHQIALAAIGDQLKRAESAADLLTVESAIRAELTDYQSKARESLGRLQTDLRSTADALKVMIESCCQSGSGDEEHVRAGLVRLRGIASSERVVKLFPELCKAVNDLETSVQQVLENNHLVVAQLRDEITTLHKSLDSSLARSQRTCPSGLLTRRELEKVIRDHVKNHRPIAAIMLLVCNRRHLESLLSTEHFVRLMAEIGERLQLTATAGSSVGVWSDQDYLQITLLPKSDAKEAARAWRASLPAPYPFAKGEQTIELDLRLRSAVIWSRENTDPEDFIQECDLFCEWRAIRTDLAVSGVRV